METLVAEMGNLLHGVHVPKVKPGAGFIEVEIASSTYRRPDTTYRCGSAPSADSDPERA